MNKENISHQIIHAIKQIILGKEANIRLALTCLVAGGHLLIEDRPGVGKTTLSHALGKVMGLHYRRVQFTSDLLPADILGFSVYDRNDNTFNFRPGPIFTQILLADEINRATPKTQSALLEAMAESQVTIEGETRPLPRPFFVIATQNPLSQIGTFPLPQSQLDRFLMCIQLGYPHKTVELALLKGNDRGEMLAQTKPVIQGKALLALQKRAQAIHAADPLLEYIQALLEKSRNTGQFSPGLSPRAGLAILRSARAWALIHQHPYVTPEDVQAILPSVINHRLHTNDTNEGGITPDPARTLIKQVPVP